jgi:hypothetical protein
VPHFNPHDLLHRRISLLHAQGRPWARVGEWVGQRNLAVTANTYTHVLTDERELYYASLLAGGYGSLATRRFAPRPTNATAATSKPTRFVVTHARQALQQTVAIGACSLYLPASCAGLLVQICFTHQA